MKQRLNSNASERLAVGMALSLTGGFLDAYTYILRGGVFANAQTGNMVLLGINLASGRVHKAAYYLIPILAFALGVLITNIVQRSWETAGKLHWQQVILITEILSLLVVGLLPVTIPHYYANIAISFVCSVQVAGFRSLEGSPYTTTMCTGNLKSAMDHLARYLFDKDKKAGGIAYRYFLVILAFCLGAASGIALIDLFAEKSIWGCALILFCILLYISKKREIKKITL